MKKNTIKSMLAIMVALGFFGILGTLLFFPIHPDSKEYLYSMISVLATILMLIVKDYFGDPPDPNNNEK